MKTLAQYQLLDTDVLLAGVAEWIVKESPLFMFAGFNDIMGNSLFYDVELTLPGIGKLNGPNETVPESTGTVAQRSISLKRYIGDADVDQFAVVTNATQNPTVTTIEEKAKGFAHEVENDFLHGGTTTQTATGQTKGILQIIAEFESTSTTDLDAPNNTQVVANHATSGDLDLEKLDELIDSVKPGKPDILMMSRACKRELKILSRASGTTLRQTQMEFGHSIDLYDGIPVLVSDFILNNVQDSAASILDLTAYDQTVTRASGYDNTYVLALKFGDMDVSGEQAGGGMTHIPLGMVQNKDAERHRFRWYLGWSCKKKFSAAVLTGVLGGAAL